MGAVSLLKSSSDFKNSFQKFDIDGSFFGETPKGDVDPSVEIIIDLYTETIHGGGVTTIEVQDKNGSWVKRNQYNKIDPDILTPESKVRIKVQLNPKQMKNNRVNIANTINHEFNIHVLGFIKSVQVLRTRGGKAFVKEMQYSSSVSSGEGGPEIIPLKYNAPSIPHAIAALGLNENYNATNSDIREQLTEEEKKHLDEIIKGNINYYSADIEIYNRVLKRKI